VNQMNRKRRRGKAFKEINKDEEEEELEEAFKRFSYFSTDEDIKNIDFGDENSKENEKEKIESKKSFLNVNLDLRRFSDERFNGLVIDFSENENYDNIIKKL